MTGTLFLLNISFITLRASCAYIVDEIGFNGSYLFIKWCYYVEVPTSALNSASNIIIGPTASFGSAIPNLTVNRLPKAYEGNGITDSLISDDGTTLRYTGTTISSSIITSTTGSFTALTVVTGSAPLTGSQVPSSPTAVGMPGQIEVDNNFIYVYTNNIWKRVPLSTWSL